MQGVLDAGTDYEGCTGAGKRRGSAEGARTPRAWGGARGGNRRRAPRADASTRFSRTAATAPVPTKVQPSGVGVTRLRTSRTNGTVRAATSTPAEPPTAPNTGRVRIPLAQ